MVTNLLNKNNLGMNEIVKQTALATRTKARNVSLNKFRWNKTYLLGFVDSHLIHYPTPITLTYAWSFGSLAGICLVIQIISGILLSLHYTANIDLAFSSVEYIMRDVPNGWFIRYVHANGASMFFIVVYSHLFRGLYYGSYMKPRQLLWCSGVVLFLLVMGTAFTGYVLPWGQMSFWGATVITNMVTAIPFGGQTIVEWLWGGFTVNAPTLRRFYTIHFLLPFIIAGLTIIHLALLHKDGSNSPIGSDTGVDDVPFYPYYFAKDLFAFTCFILFFGMFVFFFPNALNHPDNCIPADPMETPKHLVPEWYFLPFYAILRSIPHKAGGIVAMVGSILIMLVIPYTYAGYIRNTTYRPLFKIFYWLLVADFLTLMWVGQAPITDPFILLGQIASVYYFAFFLILIPIIGVIENKLSSYSFSNLDEPSFPIASRLVNFYLSIHSDYVLDNKLSSHNSSVLLSICLLICVKPVLCVCGFSFDHFATRVLISFAAAFVLSFFLFLSILYSFGYCLNAANKRSNTIFNKIVLKSSEHNLTRLLKYTAIENTGVSNNKIICWPGSFSKPNRVSGQKKISSKVYTQVRSYSSSTPMSSPDWWSFSGDSWWCFPKDTSDSTTLPQSVESRGNLMQSVPDESSLDLPKEYS